MWKVLVDLKKCIGCGVCVSACPKVFELERIAPGNIKAKVLLPETDIECVTEAAKYCPTKAIILEEL